MGSLEVLNSVNRYTLHTCLLMTGLRKHWIRRLCSWPYSFIFPEAQLHFFKDETCGKIKTHFNYVFLSFEISGICKPFFNSLPVAHKFTGICKNSNSRQTQLGALKKCLQVVVMLSPALASATHLYPSGFPVSFSVLKNCLWLIHLPLCNRLVRYFTVFSMNFPFPILLHCCTVPTLIDTSSWPAVSRAF